MIEEEGKGGKGGYCDSQKSGKGNVTLLPRIKTKEWGKHESRNQ